MSEKKGGSVFDRLTDTTQYTGSHKHRFTEDGHGRGKEGRVEVNSNDGYVVGFKRERSTSESTSKSPTNTKPTSPTNTKPTSPTKEHEPVRVVSPTNETATSPKKPLTKTPDNASATRLERSASATTKPSGGGVFDRLTDSSKYTGSHKERFDPTGKGKGKAGRVEVVSTDGYVSGFKRDEPNSQVPSKK